MKASLLPLLACPSCGCGVSLSVRKQEDLEIVEGSLACVDCRATFPIRAGVPRFIERAHLGDQSATARNFGAQWQMFDEGGDHYDSQFRDWIRPATPAFVKDSTVLEAGCGKGRHTRLLADWGAAAVVAVELSAAVDVAYRHAGRLPNVHVIQADIYRLPVRPVFDYALSIGVLHHLPDPRAGFQALVLQLRAGGAVSVWVYGREGNGWILRVIDPVRRRLTSRLPPAVLYWCSLALALPVALLSKGICGPLARRRLAAWLPYRDYLAYISRFPLREIHSIVFDHLNAPIAFYLPHGEVAAWFRDARAEQITLEWHNRNSWRGFGVVPGQM